MTLSPTATLPLPMLARFVPQEWIGNHAAEVEAKGDTEWDCTTAFAGLEAQYRAELLAQINVDGEALDCWDILKDDPEAPDWVREWKGQPFDIFVMPVFDFVCEVCAVVLRRDDAGTFIDESGGDVCAAAGDDAPHLGVPAPREDRKWRVPVWVYVEAPDADVAIEEAWQAVIAPASNRVSVDAVGVGQVEELDPNEEVYE